MFAFDVRLGCDWLWKVGVGFCCAPFVDDWCLMLMFGYVVVRYGMSMCVFVLPYFVDDLCLTWMRCYVVIGYVMFVCVLFCRCC